MTIIIALALLLQSAPHLFVVNKNEDTVSIVDTGAMTVRHSVRVGMTPHELAIAPNGSKAYVANTGDNSVSVVDLKSHAEKKITSPHFAFPHGIIFTPDSWRALVTSERSQKIVLIDAVTDQVLRAIDTDQAGTHMAVINKKGTMAFFTNRESNTVSFMDLQEFRIVANVAVGRGGEGIALSPDERELWIGDRSDSTVSVIDVAKRQTVAKIPAGPSPVRITFTPDGKYALLPDRSNDVRVYDTASRKEVATVRVEGNPGGILVSPDGKRAFVACQGSNDVKVIDTATWTIAGRIPVGRGPDGLAFH